jgi:hypothetical protein
MFLLFDHIAAFLKQKFLFQRQQLEPYSRTDFTFKILHLRINGHSCTRRNLRHELLDAGRTVPFYRGKVKQRLDSKKLIQMSELAQFAEWAFGPDGLPNLKVILLSATIRWVHAITGLNHSCIVVILETQKKTSALLLR